LVDLEIYKRYYSIQNTSELVKLFQKLFQKALVTTNRTLDLKTSTKLKALIVVSFILLAFVGGYAFYPFVNPQVPTITIGTLPGAPSSTIWKEGSTYYAKNNYNVTKYYGTNASYVVNSAIGSGDVSIFFAAATYTFTNPIRLKDNVVFDGYTAPSYWHDLGGVVFKSAITKTNESLIDGTYRKGVNIKNLKLFGDDVGTYVNGMNFTSAQSCKFENLQVSNFTGHGIVMTLASICEINSCYIGWNGLDGIYASYGFVDSFITNSYFNRNRNGVAIGEGSCHCFFIGNKFEWNDGGSPYGYGVSIYGGRWNLIQGNTIDRNSGCGIKIVQRGSYPAFKNTITGNIFRRNGRDRSSVDSAHIKIEGTDDYTNVSITDNSFDKGQDDPLPDGESGWLSPTGPLTPAYNIVWFGTTFIEITGNDFTNGCTEEWALETWNSTNNQVHNNVGWVTENSGTANVSNGDWVAHGLSPQYSQYTDTKGKPTSVVISAMLEGYYAQVVWVTDTYFGVCVQYRDSAGKLWVDTSTPVPIYWYAEIRG
jgi:hypothetical protein